MGLLFWLGGSGTGGVSVWPILPCRVHATVLSNTVAKIPHKILKNHGTIPNHPGLIKYKPEAISLTSPAGSKP